MDESEIRRQLRLRHNNISKVSRDLGINYKLLKDEYGPQPTGPVLAPSGPRPKDISSLGKPGMEQWVIAVRSNIEPNWPVEFFNEISRARVKYDAGTHEMCQQKRPDGWVVLYLIPRKVPDTKRGPYFRWLWEVR